MYMYTFVFVVACRCKGDRPRAVNVRRLRAQAAQPTYQVQRGASSQVHVCDKCRASKKIKRLLYTNCRPDAGHMKTWFTNRQVKDWALGGRRPRSPLMDIPGWHSHRAGAPGGLERHIC